MKIRNAGRKPAFRKILRHSTTSRAALDSRAVADIAKTIPAAAMSLGDGASGPENGASAGGNLGLTDPSTAHTDDHVRDVLGSEVRLPQCVRAVA